MAVFPSIDPSYSILKSSEPKIRRVKFGDGYEQRIKWGLHNNPKTWQLGFDVNTTEADEIEAFLDARAEDGTSFEWTPPGEVSASKWVCFRWSRDYVGPGFCRINLSFEQVFEP